MNGSNVPTAKTFVKLSWYTMMRKPILHGSRERLRGVRSIKIRTKREQVQKTPAQYCVNTETILTLVSSSDKQNKLILSMTKNFPFITIHQIKSPVEIVYSWRFSLRHQ